MVEGETQFSPSIISAESEGLPPQWFTSHHSSNLIMNSGTCKLLQLLVFESCPQHVLRLSLNYITLDCFFVMTGGTKKGILRHMCI